MYKKISLNLIESVLDEPMEKLNTDIWDSGYGEPNILPEVRGFILKGVSELVEDVPVKALLFVGSNTGWRYVEDSDIDITVILDVDDSTLEVIRDRTKDINERPLPGTKYPVNYFVVNEAIEFHRFDSVYDVGRQQWLKSPKDYGVDLFNVYDDFKDFVEDIDEYKSEIKRSLIDIKLLETAISHGGNPSAIMWKMVRRLKDLDKAINKIADEYEDVHKERVEAFKNYEDRTRDDEIDVPSPNLLPENIRYKLLERYHYLDFMRKIKKVADESKSIMSKEEIEKIKQIINKTSIKFDSDEQSLTEGVDSDNVYIFDLDDTLIKTDAKIYVERPDGKRFGLIPKEFNTYKLRDGESFDFSDFSDSDLLMNMKKYKMWPVLERINNKINDGKSDSKIYILTARASGVKKTIEKLFSNKGIDNITEVFTIGDIRSAGNTISERKRYILAMLRKKHKGDMHFFDDDKKNVDIAGSISGVESRLVEDAKEKFNRVIQDFNTNLKDWNDKAVGKKNSGAQIKKRHSSIVEEVVSELTSDVNNKIKKYEIKPESKHVIKEENEEIEKPQEPSSLGAKITKARLEVESNVGKYVGELMGESKLGSYKYNVPKDKKELLYDFYMYSLIHETGDEDINYAFYIVRDTLLPYLREHLLEAVLFSICAEFRHIFDRVTESTKELVNLAKERVDTSVYNSFIEFLKIYITKEKLDLDIQDIGGKNVRLSRLLYDSSSAYKDSYKAVKSSFDDLDGFVELAQIFYNELSWGSSYGGEKWGDICKGWLSLNSIPKKNDNLSDKDRQNHVVWIDHIYDLQHNTNTVLNKVQKYYRADAGGYGWILEALEKKKYIKSPYEIWGNVSLSMKRFAGFFFKSQYGTSSVKELYGGKMTNIFGISDDGDADIRPSVDKDVNVEVGGLKSAGDNPNKFKEFTTMDDIEVGAIYSSDLTDEYDYVGEYSFIKIISKSDSLFKFVYGSSPTKIGQDEDTKSIVFLNTLEYTFVKYDITPEKQTKEMKPEDNPNKFKEFKSMDDIEVGAIYSSTLTHEYEYVGEYSFIKIISKSDSLFKFVYGSSPTKIGQDEYTKSIVFLNTLEYTFVKYDITPEKQTKEMKPEDNPNKFKEFKSMDDVEVGAIYSQSNPGYTMPYTFIKITSKTDNMFKFVYSDSLTKLGQAGITLTKDHAFLNAYKYVIVPSEKPERPDWPRPDITKPEDNPNKFKEFKTMDDVDVGAVYSSELWDQQQPRVKTSHSFITIVPGQMIGNYKIYFADKIDGVLGDLSQSLSYFYGDSIEVLNKLNSFKYTIVSSEKPDNAMKPEENPNRFKEFKSMDDVKFDDGSKTVNVVYSRGKSSLGFPFLKISTTLFVGDQFTVYTADSIDMIGNSKRGKIFTYSGKSLLNLLNTYKYTIVSENEKPKKKRHWFSKVHDVPTKIKLPFKSPSENPNKFKPVKSLGDIKTGEVYSSNKGQYIAFLYVVSIDYANEFSIRFKTVEKYGSLRMEHGATGDGCNGFSLDSFNANEYTIVDGVEFEGVDGNTKSNESDDVELPEATEIELPFIDPSENTNEFKRFKSLDDIKIGAVYSTVDGKYSFRYVRAIDHKTSKLLVQLIFKKIHSGGKKVIFQTNKSRHSGSLSIDSSVGVFNSLGCKIVDDVIIDGKKFESDADEQERNIKNKPPISSHADNSNDFEEFKSLDDIKINTWYSSNKHHDARFHLILVTSIDTDESYFPIRIETISGDKYSYNFKKFNRLKYTLVSVDTDTDDDVERRVFKKLEEGKYYENVTGIYGFDKDTKFYAKNASFSVVPGSGEAKIKSLIWDDGVFEDGIWTGGIFNGGTFRGGVWKRGLFRGGIWEIGTWENGTWENGRWKNGTWQKGRWETGRWITGIWITGTWEGGIWDNGLWKNGTWRDGKWYDGTWINGTWEFGTWEFGIWKAGTWEDGIWGTGTWEDGIWHGGTWEDGTWEDGTWKDGTWKNGIWKDGTDYKRKGPPQTKKTEELTLKESKLGSYKYNVPKDKKELLYDFYMYSLMHETGDEDINYAFYIVRDALLPYLREHLLEAVLFAICAEFRHIFDKIPDTRLELIKLAKERVDTSVYKSFIKFLQIYITKSQDIVGKDVRLSRLLSDSKYSYRLAYKAVKSSFDDLDGFVELAQIIYNELSWEDAYGGEKWGDICKGWLSLNSIPKKNDNLSDKDRQNHVVWIDHIYDLQHNTNTVLNKVQKYYRTDGGGSGYRWILEALEKKKYIKSPYEIWGNVSLSMKRFAGFFFKSQYGTSSVKELYGGKMTNIFGISDDGDADIRPSVGEDDIRPSSDDEIRSWGGSELTKDNPNKFKEFKSIDDVEVGAIYSPNPTTFAMPHAFIKITSKTDSLFKFVFGSSPAKLGQTEDTRGLSFLNNYKYTIVYADTDDDVERRVFKKLEDGKYYENVTGIYGFDKDTKFYAKNASFSVALGSGEAKIKSLIWDDGVFEDGVWPNGIFNGGTFRGGVWKRGVFRGGIWEIGTWEDGKWYDGTWKNGTWLNGTWERGIWNNGLWKNGTWGDGNWEYGIWENGTWKNGTWQKGTWVDGTWNNGTWKKGTWHDGTWGDGTWEDGIWHGGTWEDGTWKDGTWRDGTWGDGTWEDGTWYGGTWEDGTWEDGTWYGGTWKDGTWKDGTWINGTWKNGTWKDGTWLNGTWKDGTDYNRKGPPQTKKTEELTLKESKLGSYKYKIPENKEALLYDFYMYTLMGGSSDDDIDYAIGSVRETLLPYLQKHLLRAVLFAICAEFRHILDQIAPEFDELVEWFERKTNRERVLKLVTYADEFSSKSNIYGKGIPASEAFEIDQKYITKKNKGKLIGTAGVGVPIRRPEWLGKERPLDKRTASLSTNTEYIASYKAMQKAYKDVEEFVNDAMFIFESDELWGFLSDYGGESWANICKGWLSLYKVSPRDYQSLVIWIDHVYDLQHNNDTVLTKVRTYYKKGDPYTSKDYGWGWINAALEKKKHIKTPYEIWGNISQSMKRLSGYYWKHEYGTTSVKELYGGEMTKIFDINDVTEPEDGHPKDSKYIEESIENLEENIKNKIEVTNGKINIIKTTDMDGYRVDHGCSGALTKRRMQLKERMNRKKGAIKGNMKAKPKMKMINKKKILGQKLNPNSKLK